jgi:hypothetical protein
MHKVCPLIGKAGTDKDSIRSGIFNEICCIGERCAAASIGESHLMGIERIICKHYGVVIEREV